MSMTRVNSRESQTFKLGVDRIKAF